MWSNCEIPKKGIWWAAHCCAIFLGHLGIAIYDRHRNPNIKMVSIQVSSGNLALSTVGLVAAVACIPFQTVTYNQNKVCFLCINQWEWIMKSRSLFWEKMSPFQLSTSGELEAAHCREVNHFYSNILKEIHGQKGGYTLQSYQRQGGHTRAFSSRPSWRARPSRSLQHFFSSAKVQSRHCHLVLFTFKRAF